MSTVEDYEKLNTIDPDKLSASGQQILYTYAYSLFTYGLEIDENGHIISSDFSKLNTFISGIINQYRVTYTTGGDNVRPTDHSEDYMKILASTTQVNF